VYSSIWPFTVIVTADSITNSTENLTFILFG
jgi:hypothetical protein